MADWIMSLQSIVFSRIKSDFSSEIKTELGMKDTSFSTVNSLNKNAEFPFVYIHLLPSNETDADMEGNEVNAGLFTFQIEVTDNKSQSRARTAMSEIVKIMKSMRFQVTATPEIDTGDTHRAVARFRRSIASEDVL